MARQPVFWSYLRWSTPPQEFGDSERRQLEPGQAWAARKGVAFIDEYRDEGISAFTAKNLTKGALGRFIEDIGSDDDALPQPGDYLGIESVDRLSRNEYILDAAAVLNELFHKGITLVLLGMGGGMEINREIARQQPGLIFMLISELQRGASESSWKSTRVRESRQTARERSRATGAPLLGGNCPAWLTHIPGTSRGEPGRYDFNEDHAKTVRQIFEWGAEGKGGAWIAHRLNESSTPTFRKIGPKMERRIAAGREPKWHPVVIRALLTDRRVLGYLQPSIRLDGKRVSDGGEEARVYPQVITDSLFARVLETRRNAKPRAGRKDRGTVNLFSGLCRCEVCRKGAVLRHQRGRDYLVCEMARHGDCANRRYFPYARLEALFLGITGAGIGDMLNKMNARNWAAHQLKADMTDQSEGRNEQPGDVIAELEERLARLRNNRTRFIDRFGDGDEEIADRIDALSAQIGEAEAELRQAREAAFVELHDGDIERIKRIIAARQRLQSDDPEEREAARSELAVDIKRRVDRVVLRPDKTVSIFMRLRRNRKPVEFVVTTDSITLPGLLPTT